MSLAPPADLVRRLSALPQSSFTEQKISERLRLTGDRHIAERQLERARESTKSQWPEVGHLSPLHPFLDWLAVFAGPSGNWMVDDLLPTLERAGVGPGMPNDAVEPDTSGLHAQLIR